MNSLIKLKSLIINNKFIILSIFINILINYRFFLGNYFFSWDAPLISKNIIGRAYPITLVDDFNIMDSRRMYESPRIFINNIIYITSNSLNLNFNSGTVSFLFILPGMIVATIFIFLFAKKKSNSVLYSIFACIFYVNSSFITASLFMGHIGIYTEALFIPLAIYYYDKFGIREGSFKKLAIILFLSSIFDFRFLILILAYIFIHEVFYFFKTRNVTTFITAFKLGAILLMLNLYWILPEIAMNISERYTPNQSNTLITRGYFGGIQNDVTFSLLNQHPNMDFASFTLFTQKNYQIILVILPLLLLTSIYIQNKYKLENDDYYLKLLIFIFFIFLSKINSFPFINSYSYLNNFFVFFTSIFRDGTRFYPLITILYIYFIAFLIKNSSKFGKLYKSILISSYIIAFCYFVYQFIRYDNYGFYQIREETYKKIDYEISNYFDENKKGNILQFRNIEYLHSFGGVNNRILDYDQYIEKFKKDPIQECQNDSNFFQNLASKFGIKYIVISKSNPNLSKLTNCIKSFKEVYIGPEYNSRNNIYENTSNVGVFYSKNNLVNYKNFQNIFYSIDSKNENTIESNIFYHPSWIAFENSNKINFLKINKNDIDSIEIINHQDSNGIYLLFYPQILLYLGVVLAIITVLSILKSSFLIKK